jgi:hypothetical protein
VLGWAWRINLIIKHPEKEERIRECEKRHKEAREEAYRKAAPVVGKFLKGVMKRK